MSSFNDLISIYFTTPFASVSSSTRKILLIKMYSLVFYSSSPALLPSGCPWFSLLCSLILGFQGCQKMLMETCLLIGVKERFTAEVQEMKFLIAKDLEWLWSSSEKELVNIDQGLMALLIPAVPVFDAVFKVFAPLLAQNWTWIWILPDACGAPDIPV